LLQEGEAGRYDAVTLFEVVEHLEDPVGYLATTSALLGPGGLIVLSVPNRDRWPMREFTDYPPHHMTRWSPRAVIALLHRVGFDVLSAEKGSRLASVHIFFGNLMRDGLYRALRLRSAFVEGEPPNRLSLPEVLPVARRMLRRYGAAARRLRDAVTWAPALLSYPFLAAFFEGYNLMVVARKRE
jgi:SAM-dependent methyltransferase